MDAMRCAFLQVLGRTAADSVCHRQENARVRVHLGVCTALDPRNLALAFRQTSVSERRPFGNTTTESQLNREYLWLWKELQ